MKKIGMSVGVGSLAAAVAAYGFVFWGAVAAQTPGQTARPVQAQQPSPDLVKRGEYLVSSVGCHDCHTPHKLGPEGPEPDMTLMLSGHQATMKLPEPPAAKGPWVLSATGTMTAWAGPWGVSYSANLTPDRETGLGEWTEEQFMQTIRNGRRQGRGRPILPPMPWPAYKNLSDEDLRAIFAYLRSVKPMKNQVPEPIIVEPPSQE
jgi:mono/diheme cytochrome c family protein